jgi:hypothetical protein
LLLGAQKSFSLVVTGVSLKFEELKSGDNITNNMKVANSPDKSEISTITGLAFVISNRMALLMGTGPF